MSVLVIGGNGFIGQNIINRLLQDAKVPSVVCMDVVPPKANFMKSIEHHADRFHFARGEVSQLDDILNIMKSFSVQKVINLAYTMVQESERMPRAVAKVNVLGMCNVFEAARILGISRVIYASSTAVYGLQSDYGDREVTEEDRTMPNLVYGMTKQLNERMADSYAEQYGISIVGFRPNSIFGHGREAEGVAAMFSHLISVPAVDKPMSINVDGLSKYVLVYVKDVAELVKILLDAPSPKHKIYNTGGYTVTLVQMVDLLRRYIPHAKIEFGHESGEIPSPKSISNARAKEEFGFSLRPIEEAVLDHINEARRDAGLEPIVP